MAKYLDYNGLVTLWSKIKDADTTTLNAAKNDTTSKINALNISSITSRIATNEGNIDTLKNDMTTAKSNITTLQSKVSTNTTDITTLKNQIGGLSGAMHFVGKFDSLPAVDSYSAGDVCVVGTKEYILVVNGSTKTWDEFGNEGDHITRSEVETNYLKKTDASSTYLTKTNASSTYLTKTTASSTYETKANVTALTTRVSTVEGYFSGGIAKKAIADKNNNDVTAYYAKATDLTSTNSNVSTNATNIKTLQSYFSSGVAKKAIADASGNNIVDTYATKSALSNTLATVSTNASNITTLKGYFTNGAADKAIADEDGTPIKTSYVKISETDATTGISSYIKNLGNAIELYLAKNLTQYSKVDVGQTGIFITIGNSEYNFENSGEFYYSNIDDDNVYLFLNQKNHTPITETEINTICQ